MEENKNIPNDQEEYGPDYFDIEDIDFEDTDMEETPARRERRIEKPKEISILEKRKRRQNAERNLAPHQSRKKPSFFDEYGRYIIIGIAAVFLVVVLVVGAISLFSRSGKKPGDGTSADPGTSQEEQTSPVIEQPPLEKNAVAEVNTLMNRYYTALLNCDLDTLNTLVEDGSKYTLEKLQKQGEYIEDYQNIICYTKPGMNEGEYVLYVYSEMKFANIDTAAPQLNRYYLDRSANGQLVIANGTVSEEKLLYMDELNEHDDVQALIQGIADQFDAALAADQNLNDFVEVLNRVVADPSGTGEDPSSEEPSSEEPSTQPPAESGTFYVNGELFYAVDETVYPKEDVRVRALNSLESDVVGMLTTSDYVQRTGYSENWSQIVYNGYTAYVYKGYLTTNPPR